MTEKTIKISLDEIHAKSPKKNYATNKTDVYRINVIWSLDIFDLRDYSPENNRRCRFFMVVTDNSSKFGWVVPLKSNNAQTKKSFLKMFF